MTSSSLLHALCAAIYLALAFVVLLGGRRDRTSAVLALSCLVTALWAGGIALDSILFGGGGADEPGTRVLELAQEAGWYVFVLHLYSRAVPNGSRLIRILGRLGLLAILAVGASIAATTPLAARLGLAFDPLPTLGIDARLGLAICTLLLIENLYRNTSEDLRWHIALPCVALSGLFVYDIVLYSDAALFRRTSADLFDGRAVVTALLTPLLAISVRRNRRRWGLVAPDLAPRNGLAAACLPGTAKHASIRVSQQAVFYSASLVVTGVFLLALALTGEVLRALLPGRTSGWGTLIEVSLMSGGVLAVAVLLTSGSARSSLRNLLVKNFFTLRYDYRLEWLRCIETLSQAKSHVALHTRVIKAVAQTVDSPAGMVFLRDFADADPGQESGAPLPHAYHWAGSWNFPASAHAIAADHPLLGLFGDGQQVVEAPPPTTAPSSSGSRAGAGVSGLGLSGLGLSGLGLSGLGLSGLGLEPLAGEGIAVHELWLAVPLSHVGRLLGFILLARPRATFVIDQEVIALLRIVGQEVASYIAEQRAAEALIQARQLREYGQRFAFVAHDIKNVASQLALLLDNAEHHIANPAFQRDMLATIGGSVQKINTLLARLKAPAESPATDRLLVRSQLSALLDGYPAARRRRIVLHDQSADAPDAEQQDRAGQDTQSGDGYGWPVCMSPAAFTSIMMHLLDNAFEASGPDDLVEIVCRRSLQNAFGQAPYASGRPYLLIDIIDHGVGMTADFIREQLFRPFGSSKAGGFGIGVYQARELLRGSGGELTVSSTPGRGTAMRLSLPLLGETERQVAEVMH